MIFGLILKAKIYPVDTQLFSLITQASYNQIINSLGWTLTSV